MKKSFITSGPCLTLVGRPENGGKEVEGRVEEREKTNEKTIKSQ